MLIDGGSKGVPIAFSNPQSAIFSPRVPGGEKIFPRPLAFSEKKAQIQPMAVRLGQAGRSRESGIWTRFLVGTRELLPE
jgi:hypothetical protein